MVLTAGAIPHTIALITVRPGTKDSDGQPRPVIIEQTKCRAAGSEAQGNPDRHSKRQDEVIEHKMIHFNNKTN